MPGYTQAKATRDKLVGNKQLGKDLKVAEPIREGDIEAIMDTSLASFYKENAMVGSEDVSGGKVPALKIHVVGRSKSELPDGSEPNNGWYFYTATKEQFEKVEVHILSISRGYYAKPLEGSGKEKVFTQLLGGMLVNGKEYQPFIMYMTGLKLQPMWDFTRETVSVFTHNIKQPVPMFALLVEMGTEKVDTKFGKSFIPTFKLKMNDKNQVLIVNDVGLSQFLLDSVSMIKEMMENLIKIGDISEGDEHLTQVPPPSDDEFAKTVQEAVS